MIGFGPALVTVGACSLVVGGCAFWFARGRTIFAPPRESDAPTPGEQLSIVVLVYAVWSIGFGAVLCRGVALDAIDVRFDFEKRWPVIEWAEWIYASVYVVPLFVPFAVRSRRALRRFSIDLWLLLGVAIGLYLTLPFTAPPRAFIPRSLAGEILALELSRPDFAAAAFPSFHVFWPIVVRDAHRSP